MQTSTLGKFITVDGIDGAGKSTQLAFIRAYVETLGYPVVVTREPGGTALGEDIRALLIGRREETMAVDTEVLLMFAARAEHIHRVVRPALAAGTWVVCDRFTDATYAYQGAGGGVLPSRIALLEEWVQGSLRPDLTLLFDLPVEEGLKRAGQRARAQADRFEVENPGFFQRVRRAYRDLAAGDPKRYRVIDANRPVEAIQADLKAILQTLD